MINISQLHNNNNNRIKYSLIILLGKTFKNLYILYEFDFQKKGILSLNEYNNFTFFDLSDIILNIAGNKYKTKGYINPIIKLEIESVIKIR